MARASNLHSKTPYFICYTTHVILNIHSILDRLKLVCLVLTK